MANLGKGKVPIKGRSGVFPTYQKAGIANYVNQFTIDKTRKILLMLQKVGEDFVTNARNTDTYTDRTSNLRSSIGYAVFYNGSEIYSNFEGESTGMNAAQAKVFEQMVFPRGFVLIGVAGMKYARYVEAKHFDVISGSEPSIEEIQEYVDEIE